MSECELKPCPFCGNLGHLELRDDIWRVRCSICSAVSQHCISKSQAIAAWNARTPSLGDRVLKVLTKGATIECDESPAGVYYAEAYIGDSIEAFTVLAEDAESAIEALITKLEAQDGK